MLPQLEMRFYYHREKGRIVVQNAIMGMMGQEHTHTEKDFKQWARDIPSHCLVDLDEH